MPYETQFHGAAPEYNNVDATLWYFTAIYKYLHATDDHQFVLNQLLPVLSEIIDWHFKGTRYHIHVTEDGLLYSGEPGVQLTWMDAKIGDWVVTPRTGKAVEINALWYNALVIYSLLLELNGKNSEATQTKQKAALAKQSFNEQFWHDLGNLYVVDASFFPSCGAFNPALTIAANALRVGDYIINDVLKLNDVQERSVEAILA